MTPTKITDLDMSLNDLVRGLDKTFLHTGIARSISVANICVDILLWPVNSASSCDVFLLFCQDICLKIRAPLI
jgi:hypothetical protein